MAPIEVDYFNRQTQVSIEQYDITNGSTEIIDHLPPAQLEVSCDDSKKEGTLNVNGNKDHSRARLYKGEDDEEGVPLNLSHPNDFGEGQTIEIESEFHDEMVALTYYPPSGESQPSVRKRDLVPV
jgi:hypothetical protein